MLPGKLPKKTTKSSNTSMGMLRSHWHWREVMRRGAKVIMED
jgi:hypothetical protein